MAEAYKPALTEIAREMGADVGRAATSSLNYVTKPVHYTSELINKASPKLTNGGRGLVAGLVGVVAGASVAHFVLDMDLFAGDMIAEPVKNRMKLTDYELDIATMGSLIGFLGTIWGYAYEALGKKHYGYLLIPVATNGIAGVTSWGRRARERVIEKHKLAELLRREEDNRAKAAGLEPSTAPGTPSS